MTVSELTGAGAAVGVGVVALTFTAADINTAIIGVTALITAIGIAVVNIMAQRAVAKKVDAGREIQDRTLAKVEVVEGHVNSAASAAAGREEALQKELKLLREMLAGAEQRAAVLAQAAAVVVQGPALVQPLSVEPIKVEVINAPLPVILDPKDEG